MIKFYPTVKALFVISFMLVVASAAQAQATRTWVSGVGDDLNPCSRTAPCKTFACAISKTSARIESGSTPRRSPKPSAPAASYASRSPSVCAISRSFRLAIHE